MTKKYQIACSGCGWGIWTSEGVKVMSCSSRFDALDKLYELMGWKKPAYWR